MNFQNKQDKKYLQTQAIKKYLISGIYNVINNSEEINKLNVFPIPDGDTGTNLSSTCLTAYKSFISKEFSNPQELCFVFSKGLLMGARGNSGIIFTQIVRGFTEGIKKNKLLTVADYIEGLILSEKFSYNAVNKPVEGTMLSLVKYCAKHTSKKLKRQKNLTIKWVLEETLKDLKKALKKTPSQLKVLKEANVVDSGGYGLVCFFEGIYLAAINKPVKLLKEHEKLIEIKEISHNAKLDFNKTMLGYCTEFVLQLFDSKVSRFKDTRIKKILKASKMNSIVIVRDKNIVKVHLHTFKPHRALWLASTYGEFLKIKIDNMTLQNDHFQEIVSSEVQIDYNDNKLGLLIITNSKGWVKIFKEFDPTEILYYSGAHNKPNTAEILKAINATACKKVIIISNSKDIVLTIEEAIKLADKQNCKIAKTADNGQGYFACINYSPDSSLTQTYELMKSSIDEKVSLVFSCAEKDAISNSLKITKGDFICLKNNKIISNAANLEYLIIKEISKFINKNTEIITIVKEKLYNQKIFDEVLKRIKTRHKNIEIEIKDGGQDIHNFSILIE